MRDVFIALQADEVISSLEEEEAAFIEEMAEALERQKDKSPALRDIPKKKLFGETANAVKFCVSLKHTALQSLVNYFMQELLLLQIGWE